MAAAGGAAGLGAAAAGLLGNSKAGKQLKMAQQGKKMADGLVRVCLHLSVSKFGNYIRTPDIYLHFPCAHYYGMYTRSM